MSSLPYYIVVPNISSDQKKRIEKLLRSTYNLKEFIKTGTITTAILDDKHFCFYHSLYIPGNDFKGFCFKVL